jgi:DNA primase
MVRAQWWYDDIDRVRRIVWPIWTLEKELVGWVGRDIDNPKGSPRKYRNMPNMNAVKTLYPLPLNRDYPERTVILVEGIPDALRLLQAGLPALANLGTAWSKTRTHLLMSMEFTRVILAFDGDEAGHRANLEIGQKLYPLGIDREVWEWPEGSDPGDAPYEEIKRLRQEVMPRGAPKPHPWLLAAPTIQRHWLSDFHKGD